MVYNPDGQRVRHDAVSVIKYDVVTDCRREMRRRERVRGLQVGRWAVSGGWPLAGRPTTFSDGAGYIPSPDVSWVAHVHSGYILTVHDDPSAFKTCVRIADIVSLHMEDLDSDDWAEVHRRVTASPVWAWLTHCNAVHSFVDYREWAARRKS